MHAHPSIVAASRPPLLLSRLDVERIEALLEQPSFRSLDTSALQEELGRAELAEPAAIPDDVITMNSTARVRVEDPVQGPHEHELTLVYPRDADGRADRVSILAPVGSALLGLRVGNAIDWPLPGGRNARLQVLAVRYQPEAAGDLRR
ncbi:MAG TPA: nucleoside diphosphate kinase regulator [Thermomonas sp.]|nr:nucleoside diphosphate kinase regulator [Thermomonas sp.]